jgi:hypothetical protein
MKSLKQLTLHNNSIEVCKLNETERSMEPGTKGDR